jgi:elongation of very long chain fatty acids protein 6
MAALTLQYVWECQWLSAYHDWRSVNLWMQKHFEVPLGLCFLYLVAIFAIQRAMQRRQGFDLTGLLFLWNGLLATFSFVGAVSTVPYIYAVVAERGFKHDLCTTDSEGANPWVYLFCMSKIPELLDTIFIVLRKRPLIFLHYYHHVMTLLYCWHAWAYQIPNGGWFAAMNLIIHSLMYSYYAAGAYGVRFSNHVRVSITSLQILQMVLGVAIILHNFLRCNTHPENYIFGLVMYSSYMVLFIKLFLDSYVFKKRAGSHAKDKAAEHVRDEQEQEVTDSKKKRPTKID